jgi:hypothetical protein
VWSASWNPTCLENACILAALNASAVRFKPHKLHMLLFRHGLASLRFAPLQACAKLERELAGVAGDLEAARLGRALAEEATALCTQQVR